MKLVPVIVTRAPPRVPPDAGATAAMAGFLGAGVHPPVLAIVLFAAALVAAPVAGFLCDSWGPIRIMRGSMFLSGLILLVLLFRPAGLFGRRA